MRVWRISKLEFAEQAFSGLGAKLYGGRWNFAGSAVVYTSASLALAAVETFVHLPSLLVLPKNLAAVAADIPDDLEQESIVISDLPANWKETPAPDGLKVIGAEWLRGNRSAVLAVPSVVIQTEWNYLLNPAHRDFAGIRIGRPQPFKYDPRMKK